MIESLPFQVADLVDILLVWLLLWAGIAWLRTNPARLALAGIAILGAIFFAARQLGLELTTRILQGFFAVSVLIAVVVFQQELRRLFEQIASFGPFRRRHAAPGLDAVDALVRALATLAGQHRGALVVMPGREPLERHLDGGVELDALVSEPLLLSIFDPHSPGHDGAILLQGDRVVRFAAHLPLSTDHAQLGQRGTRHAAALGLAERTDALCLVVSEERGVVSVARESRLETLPTPQTAGERIRRFLQDLTPEGAGSGRPWTGALHRWREALLAVPLAAALWFLAIPGSNQVVVEREAPITITGLPEEFELESIDPPSARVRLAGRQRDLLLLDRRSVTVRVDVILVELGRRTFRIDSRNVVHPEGVTVVGVEPNSVRLDLQSRTPPAEGPQGES